MAFPWQSQGDGSASRAANSRHAEQLWPRVWRWPGLAGRESGAGLALAESPPEMLQLVQPALPAHENHALTAHAESRASSDAAAATGEMALWFNAGDTESFSELMRGHWALGNYIS